MSLSTLLFLLLLAVIGVVFIFFLFGDRHHPLIERHASSRGAKVKEIIHDRFASDDGSTVVYRIIYENEYGFDDEAYCEVSRSFVNPQIVSSDLPKKVEKTKRLDLPQPTMPAKNEIQGDAFQKRITKLESEIEALETEHAALAAEHQLLEKRNKSLRAALKR